MCVKGETAINRNRLMLLNAVVVVVTMVANLVLGMLEVSLLISKFGSSINGLVQTGNQALGYLSLIEAGICAAFIYRMYQPVADRDNKRLSSLYIGFRKSIRKVVNKMLVCAAVISVLYPFFLKKESLDYFFIVSVFLLLSLKTILPYQLTIVPKYMIVLKERKYLAEIISGVCRAATYLAEILLLLFTDLPLQFLLGVSILIAIVTGLWFHYAMRKLYKGTLDPNVQPDLSPKSMSKDILLHNISRLVFSSTSNIIISAMGSLNAVTVYSSYNMVTGQVGELAQRILDGASASLGIKIAQKDANAYSVYREMLLGVYFMAGIMTSVFMVMINDFITLWIGSEFCVGVVDRALFGLSMYCAVILPCIQTARNARGLYKESRNFTIAQSVLNLVISLILVPFIGITGALLGTVIARIIITVPFNYVLVDKRVFPKTRSKWYELIFGLTVTLFAVGINSYALSNTHLRQITENDILVFIIRAALVTLISGAVMGIYYWITDKSFRRLISRLLSYCRDLISKRKQKAKG